MDIKALAEKYKDYIIEKRRWFHQYPELSMQEENTTNAIVKELEAIGIPVKRFDGIYGCVGELKGGRPGKTILLRADIDALPVIEQTGLPFASKNEGRMHACGHDCHIAMLLGTAKILYEGKEELAGTVRFFFQPGEEIALGAKAAIGQGVMEHVDTCFGMHVWSQLRSPYFNIEYGERMASCDSFTLTVFGEAAHGSSPHLGRDAIVAASSIIMNLQAISSRMKDPLGALVVTIGTMNGGQNYNIIPDRVQLEGTVRTFNREFQDSMKGRILEIAENTARCYGCTVDLQYNCLTIPIVNDNQELLRICKNAAVKLFGADTLSNMKRLTSSEDFSFLMDQAPGIFGYLGSCHPEIPGSEYSNHHEKFTVDEEILHRGSAITAQYTIDFLEENQTGNDTEHGIRT